jgi:hypothetical protein
MNDKSYHCLSAVAFTAFALLLAGAAAHAQSDPPDREKYRELEERSPFIDKAYQDRLNAAQLRGATDLSFQGYIRLEDRWHFSLHDRRNNQGFWLIEGEEKDGIVITRFDSANQTVNVNVRGTVIDLRMEQAGAAGSGRTATQGGGGGQPAAAAPAAETPRARGGARLSEADRARFEAMRNEWRRRRQQEAEGR